MTSPSSTLLIVEDHRDSQECLRMLFEGEGLTCETANDIREAVAKFNARCDNGQECYDAIVLDVHLPSASGLGLLRAVRQARKQLPVFILTAYGDDLVKFRAKEFNAGYNLKPLDDVGAYVSRVAEAARTYQAHRPLEIHPPLELDDVIEEMMDRSVA